MKADVPASTPLLEVTPNLPELEKTVIEWLNKFSLNYAEKSADELKTLAQEWSKNLSRFKPSQVEAAFSLAYDECEYFPIFAQILERIPKWEMRVAV